MRIKDMQTKFKTSSTRYAYYILLKKGKNCERYVLVHKAIYMIINKTTTNQK